MQATWNNDTQTKEMIEATFTQGYSDGLNGIDREFRNDDDLSDAYIDGHEEGQRVRYPVKG